MSEFFGHIGNNADFHRVSGGLQHVIHGHVENHHLNNRHQYAFQIAVYKEGNTDDDIAEQRNQAFDVHVRLLFLDHAGHDINTAGGTADFDHKRRSDPQHNAGHTDREPEVIGCYILVHMDLFHGNQRNRRNYRKEHRIHHIFFIDGKPRNNQQRNIDNQGNITDVDAENLMAHHGNAVHTAGCKIGRVYKCIQADSRQQACKNDQKNICKNLRFFHIHIPLCCFLDSRAASSIKCITSTF